MLKYWPLAIFALTFGWSVWMVWRNLSRGTVRMSGREWAKAEAPRVYWTSTGFYAVFATLLLIGLFIRGPASLIAP